MDICSQEAEWNLFEVAGQYIADKCQEITGIALGNSKTETPAFKDAKRLAFLQCFNENEEKKEDLTSEKNIKDIIAKHDDYLRSKM
jgi:hypothetical protein